MRTVGLDIATHTGIALVGDEDDKGKVIHFKNERGFLRLAMIATEVERTLLAWEPDLVLVEAYAFARNVSSFTRLVECGTVIREVLYRRKMKWAEVTPTTLKKWTTGKGNASKEDMAVSVKSMGFSSWSHDIIDAMALAKMGQIGEANLRDINGVSFY